MKRPKTMTEKGAGSNDPMWSCMEASGLVASLKEYARSRGWPAVAPLKLKGVRS